VSERGACLLEAYGPTLGPIASSSHSGRWALYLVLVRLVRSISNDLDVLNGESVEHRHVVDQENGHQEVTEEYGRGAGLVQTFMCAIQAPLCAPLCVSSLQHTYYCNLELKAIAFGLHRGWG
jgi:hypothetical protein